LEWLELMDRLGSRSALLPTTCRAGFHARSCAYQPLSRVPCIDLGFHTFEVPDTGQLWKVLFKVAFRISGQSYMARASFVHTTQETWGITLVSLLIKENIDDWMGLVALQGVAAFRTHCNPQIPGVETLL